MDNDNLYYRTYCFIQYNIKIDAIKDSRKGKKIWIAPPVPSIVDH